MFKQILEQRIRHEGISIREAARKIGTAPMTISRIMNDEPYDLSTLLLVCRWLDIKPSDALDESLPSGDGLSSKLAMLLQSKPELDKMFSSAMEQVENGKVDMTALADVMSYMAFRLQRTI